MKWFTLRCVERKELLGKQGCYVLLLRGEVFHGFGFSPHAWLWHAFCPESRRQQLTFSNLYLLLL